MKKLLAILLFSYVLLYSCYQKDDDKPSCQPLDLIENKNRLSEMNCILNGHYWEAYAPFYLPGSLNSRYDPQNNLFVLATTLRVYGNSLGNPCFEVSDTIFQSIGLTVSVQNVNEAKLIFRENSFTDIENTCFGDKRILRYSLDTQSTRFIKFIEFDLDRGVAIGEFEYNAIQINCPEGPDTMRIRDGRFEVYF